MIKIKRRLTILAVVGILCTNVSAQTVTQVQVNVDGKPNQNLSFTVAPRLDSLVLNSLKYSKQPMAQIDWLSSSLFDVSTPYIDKDKVISTIEYALVNASVEQRKPLAALKNQIQSLFFAKRVFSDLDPDFVRISQTDNPKVSGEFVLSLKHQSNHVDVFGAVHKGKRVDWHSRHSALAYITSDNLLNQSQSTVVVIQPDGNVESHSIAYWNENFKEVAPGAMIYVPFNSAESKLDSVVISLLRNRI